MTIRGSRTHRTSGRSTIAFAKELRKNGTEAEAILWERLRKKAVEGFRFCRQHPIGPYIADFFCNEALLVIEVDGGIHFKVELQNRDRLRDAAMKKHGLRILRFTNQEVEIDLDEVVKRIRTALLCPAPPPTSNCLPGEGPGGGS